jgi:predicted esterase
MGCSWSHIGRWAAILTAVACFGQSKPVATAPRADRVQIIEFSTKSPPPVSKVVGKQAVMARMIRVAGETLDEGLVVQAALASGSGQQGLSPEQSKSVWTHLKPIYKSLREDPVFRSVPSALPYAYSAKRHPLGHAFVSLPAQIDAATPWVVFLHGDAGNFLYYVHQMRGIFPEAIVILPTHGTRWRRAKRQYVLDAIGHVQKQVGIKSVRPTLVALSGAGPTAFEFYAEDAKRWSGLVAVATAPQASTIRQMSRDHRILMINGTEDRRFDIQLVRRRVKLLAARSVRLKTEEVNADHFLMLREADQTKKWMRRFVLPQAE